MANWMCEEVQFPILSYVIVLFCVTPFSTHLLAFAGTQKIGQSPNHKSFKLYALFELLNGQIIAFITWE